jgi:hypothetical protein
VTQATMTADPSSMALSFRGVRRWLALVDRDGQRCAGLVLLSAVVVGTVAVQLLSGPLELTSAFSLTVLTMLLLQLFGPLLVAVIALVRLMPDWVERSQRLGPAAWRSTVVPAGAMAVVLMLQFLGAGLLAGALASPRADLVGELAEVLGDLRPEVLLLALLRSAVFLMAVAGWTLRETALGLRRGEPAALIVGEGLLHGLVLLLVLKLSWSLAIYPWSFGVSV